MLSRQDLLRYFEQVACLERQKIHGVHEVLESVEDPYVARILLRIGSSGMEHYQAILELFDSKTLRQTTADQRLNVRRSALGVVRIIRKSQGPHAQQADGYSVNLSTRGMCLEASYPLEVGEPLDLKVMLYGVRESSAASGKVVWSREVLPGLHMFGIAFGV